MITIAFVFLPNCPEFSIFFIVSSFDKLEFAFEFEEDVSPFDLILESKSLSWRNYHEFYEKSP